MIIEENFRLRLLEQQDLFWLKKLRENPVINEYLGTFCLLNDFRQENWFNNLQNDEKRCYMVFEKQNLTNCSGNNLNEENIDNFNNFPLPPADMIDKLGIVRISNIDLINRSMCVGGDIDPRFQGNKYAKIMYKLIFKYGFECMNMHRLYLYVLEDNIKARNCYEKVGFITEGMQREAIFNNGKYKNYLIMSILKSEYQAKYGKVT